MSPLTSSERDCLAENIQQIISHTPFACSSLASLPGGTTSFVFRGSLIKPILIQRGRFTKTVIVKHATDFASCNQDFPVDGLRSEFEDAMLHALGEVNWSGLTSEVPVETPRSYFYDAPSRVQVIEDVPNAVELANVVKSYNTEATQTLPSLMSIGFALGSWLRTFHQWSSESAQSDLQQKILRNKPMRDLKRRITYDTIVSILAKYPNVRREYQKELEEIQNVARKEFAIESTEVAHGSQEWGIIHGDFWTGNVLLVPSPKDVEEPLMNAKMCVIDWEFAQYGHRSIDLGQMIGDLIEMNHFNPSNNFTDLVEGLVKGYGTTGDDMGFRIAIYVGVHMINWHSRHPSPHRDLLNQAESLMRVATEFVVRAWKKDRIWLEGTVLGCLFR